MQTRITLNRDTFHAVEGYLNGNKYTMQRPIQKLSPFEINNSTKRKLKNEN